VGERGLRWLKIHIYIYIYIHIYIYMCVYAYIYIIISFRLIRQVRREAQGGRARVALAQDPYIYIYIYTYIYVCICIYLYNHILPPYLSGTPRSAGWASAGCAGSRSMLPVSTGTTSFLSMNASHGLTGAIYLYSYIYIYKCVYIYICVCVCVYIYPYIDR